MSDLVRITDVSPRDGLQNEPGVIPTSDKVKLVELLCKTGVDEIEVTSFVSAKWVPQLGDGAEVLQRVHAWLHANWTKEELPGVPCLSMLVPNQQGMQAALRAHAGVSVEKIAVFAAASETFSQKNLNATIEESLERFRPVMEMARLACGQPIHVRAYISCVIACPFEGPISPEKVADVAARLIEIGADEIDLGDTIGVSTAENVSELLRVVTKRIGKEWLAKRSVGEYGLTLHLHDTFGRAAECVRAALDLGVRSFDGSVAGLGGCPYASKTLPDGTIQRAPGNIATELLVRTIHEAGYRTNVDLNALADAAAFAREIVAKSRAGAGS
ncbi:MAG: hydroxymethylglutaryl-CoA lyase [Phycisphaerales bacterium]|nr:hydroxymethylglutaryl-CoA lyase [Phycisphaerales bacterium]